MVVYLLSWFTLQWLMLRSSLPSTTLPITCMPIFPTDVRKFPETPSWSRLQHHYRRRRRTWGPSPHSPILRKWPSTTLGFCKSSREILRRHWHQFRMPTGYCKKGKIWRFFTRRLGFNSQTWWVILQMSCSWRFDQTMIQFWKLMLCTKICRFQSRLSLESFLL